MQRVEQTWWWRLLENPGGDLLEILGWSALAVLSITLLIWSAVRIRSWYRDGEDPAADANTMLLQFHEMHRQGVLTEAEYRSIKGRLITDKENSAPPSSK